MRRLVLILAGLSAAPAAAQDQQQALNVPAASPAANAAPFDMVAGDRETAWRINRQTGDVMVCRIDTTSALDAVRARCAPAAMETGPQQSAAPAGGGRP